MSALFCAEMVGLGHVRFRQYRAAQAPWCPPAASELAAVWQRRVDTASCVRDHVGPINAQFLTPANKRPLVHTLMRLIDGAPWRNCYVVL